MEIPSLEALEANLRNCLLLKGDDLYFTMRDPEGATLRKSFLGVEVEGLAGENLSEDEVSSIDVQRFAITDRVRQLRSMLDDRRLSLCGVDIVEVEEVRNEALDFLEHFLSTLPNVALGGVDLTSSRNGEVRRLYELAYAWSNLIETIEDSFQGETESALAVTDLALMSTLDLRTLRNRCGPGKLIRTSVTRSSRNRNSASPALVRLNALDAVDWLLGRKGFRISNIGARWIVSKLVGATPTQATRGLLVAGIVNVGTLASLAPRIGCSPEQARTWFDRGDPLPSKVGKALKSHLCLEV